jgi:hypothetical protein
MPDFGPLWNSAPGGTIEYEGRRLQRSYQLLVAQGDRLHFLFEEFVQRPVQGLGIRLDDRRGALEVAGTQARDLVLWTDTAARHVECVVRKAKPGAHLRLMNQWRDEKYGTTMLGLNAAAMEVLPQSDGSIILACSDGWGTEPNFSDLVMRLIIERAPQVGKPPVAAV